MRNHTRSKNSVSSSKRLFSIHITPLASSCCTFCVHAFVDMWLLLYELEQQSTFLSAAATLQSRCLVTHIDARLRMDTCSIKVDTFPLASRFYEFEQITT